MPINSRSKGKTGELELAAIFTAAGFPSRRAQQFKGGQHSQDLWSPDMVRFGLHTECKRVETAKMQEWLAKARQEVDGTDLEPLICWRKNRGEWVAVLPLAKLLELLGKVP